MHRTRVGVIRGGPTPAYELSLKTGAAALSALSPERFETRDIFVDRSGQWHVRGMPVPPERALSQIDVAVGAIHGAYGEDGTLSRLLETHAVPYVGADSFGHALALSKPIAKERLSQLGILTPVATTLSRDELSERSIIDLFRSFPQPSIIKPLSGSASIGIFVARDFDSFANGLIAALDAYPTVLIEEYIQGKEAVVGTISQFRDEAVYALPAVELDIDRGIGHFDYARKLSHTARHRSPAGFSSDEKQELERIARAAHQALSMRHFGKHDLILSRRGVLYLESNALPELHEGSPFALSLQAVGASPSSFLEHAIGLARR